MPETHLSYNMLKSILANKKNYQDHIEYYKEYFREEIQSERRYSCIRTFDDLLDCLERLDILSENNIAALHKIVGNISDDEIAMALDQYVPPPEPFDQLNAYALQRIEESKNIKAEFKSEPLKTKQKPIIIFEFTEEKRNKIYKLIARDIGRTWRFFGRELSVRAGELDNIDMKHPNDLQSKVFEVFEIFENDPRHSPREHYNIICEALDNCKRKDIRRDVQKIMSN